MVHTPSPPVVAPPGDDDRDGFVLFAGMFSGIPRWRLRLPSIIPLECARLRPRNLRLVSLVHFLLLKSLLGPCTTMFIRNSLLQCLWSVTFLLFLAL